MEVVGTAHAKALWQGLKTVQCGPEVSRSNGEDLGFYAKIIEEAIISQDLSIFHLPTSDAQ